MAPLATFEDSALIQLALAGQTECFTVLTNRHLPAVRRSIGPMVPNATDVDDVLQEVLLKVWRHLATFRFESTFRTWMTRVAINQALQSHRLEQRRPICQALGDFDTFASPHESPHQYLARVEAAQTIRSAVLKRPPLYSRVLTLCDLEQLSIRETAQKLQASVPTVKTQLFRARRLLLLALRRSNIRRSSRVTLQQLQ
jgi:RNA polymerase sigma-70 factor (ECF subfamily)